MKKYPTITFRLDHSLLKAINKEAKRAKTSVGSVIRDAVHAHLGIK
jgi:predicted HicB family RNase H-like nuclease